MDEMKARLIKMLILNIHINMENKSHHVEKQDEKLLNLKKIKGQGTIEASGWLRLVAMISVFSPKTMRRSNEPHPSLSTI